jgi:hypothetical protein
MPPATPAPSSGLARHAPWAALLAASIASRFPALLNADQTNSDAAVVGLQAMHILHGERSPFLWGSGYQTSVDSSLVALGFAAFGAKPLVLMAVPLALHVLLTWLVFDVLRRRTAPSGPWLAALVAAPLAITSSPSLTYVLYPPRQAALTLAVAALWALERATDASRRRRALLVAGGALASLACFADPYALVMTPAAVVLVLLGAVGRSLREALGALATAAAGALAGLAPLLALWSSARATHGQVGLTTGVIAHNVELLTSTCLPWTLGARTYFARHVMDYAPWDAPLAVRALQLVGGLSILALLVWSAALALGKRVAWPVRRLGLAGTAGALATLLGFLVSVMVMDLFSSRYLAAMILVLPLALAPLAARLGTRGLAVALVPYLIAAGVAGWVGFGPFVEGVVPVRVVRGESDEARLATELAARGITYATADYWTSYRLTFLTREALVVVPTNLGEDRYPPYRAAFDEAARVAYVFDPARSREAQGSFEARVAAGETPFEPAFERIGAGELTAVVLHRRGASTVTAR